MKGLFRERCEHVFAVGSIYYLFIYAFKIVVVARHDRSMVGDWLGLA
jgi:hypothetical protein